MTPKQLELARRREYEANRVAVERIAAEHDAWMAARIGEALREGRF